MSAVFMQLHVGFFIRATILQSEVRPQRSFWSLKSEFLEIEIRKSELRPRRAVLFVVNLA